MKNIIDVKNLKVSFKVSRKETINIVRGLDIQIPPKTIVGLVGESGSGKTVTSKALLSINLNAVVSADKMMIGDFDANEFKNRDWSKIRGDVIGYIPQDPMTSLNPTRTIKKQMMDVLEKDDSFENNKARVEHIISLLESFGIVNAKDKINSYPHMFSGGMKQRVVIAMILLAKPKLIIADEPTTALDPTVQASVLSLLEKIRSDFGISIIFISHNIAVVAKFCDYINIMYAGRIIEKGTKKEIFTDPRHPYTWALLNAIPEEGDKTLITISGTPPDMANLSIGDPFAPRNEYALAIDFKKEPPLFKVTETHWAATWLLHPNSPIVPVPHEVKKRIKLFKGALNV